MNNELQIADDFLAPLFDEIFEVKEKDFSIQYNVLGLGKQKLLLLVDAQGIDYLADPELQLLKSIIDKGLRKDFDDVWVLNLNTCKDATLQELINHFKPFQLIVWGCENWIKREKIKLENHQQAMLSNVDLLKAYPLNTYLTDNALKSKLWIALQRMFFN
ncbi:MAG: hypothetical protein H7296_01905 [Bacteroidia bacterium]|nr:hypothetical protein [Bacteroidia bacterium]